MPNSAWGIDLGNRALKAIKLTREGERLRVEDFEIIEHEQILSVSGDNKESILQTALANFVQRHKTKGVPVGVAVSGQQSFARFIKLPPVEEKKIPEIVRFEAIQQIPFPLDDVEWSYQLFREKDSPDVEVGILAIKKDLVNRHIGNFTKLGLNVQCVQMHPLAVYNAMHADGRTAQTTMFMDSGAENTDLIITDGQTVWLRTLPIGGNNFTETLAKAFKLSFVKAEELKRNAATSKYAKQIFQAMRPVFADLVAEIQRSIGFYASVHRDARITKIVAQGSTFQLPGLQKYLQQNLQLPVEKLDSFKALPPTDAKVAAAFSENLISLAGAYGLAVQTMGDAKITASLLPEHIRREKMWLDKTKWFAAAAATFLLGTALIGARYYLDSHAYAANENLRRSNAAAVSEANNIVDKWNRKIQSQQFTTAKQQIQVLRGIESYRALWTGRPDMPDRGKSALTGILQAILEKAPPNDIEKFLTISQRGKRPQIVIRSILSEYRSDLTDVLSLRDQQLESVARPETGLEGAPAPGRSGGRADEAALRRGWGMRNNPGATAEPTTPTPAVAVKRGFVITIYGSTPNDDGERFVESAFLEPLREMTEVAQAKGTFYVARAKAKSWKAGLAGIGFDRGAAAVDTRRGRAIGGAAADAAKEDDPAKDRAPFEKETTANDTVFQAVVVIVLDPKPVTATASK